MSMSTSASSKGSPVLAAVSDGKMFRTPSVLEAVSKYKRMNISNKPGRSAKSPQRVVK